MSFGWSVLVRMAVELFPFRYFDPLCKRWVNARYKATRQEIAARYARWEITGPGWTPSQVGRGTCGQLREPSK